MLGTSRVSMLPSYAYLPKLLDLSFHTKNLTKTIGRHRTFTKATGLGALTTTRCHEIKSRILEGIHPLQLFRIVQDVDRYKDFLPLCSESNVFQDTITDQGRSFRAELVVGFGPLGSMFQTRYVSQVSVDPLNLKIETKSDGGVSAVSNTDHERSSGSMFDSLTSCWQLQPVAQHRGGPVIGTSVDFKVEMAVSDPVTIAVLNQVLYNVAETQVDAFHRRCKTTPPPTPEELVVAEGFYDTHSRTKVL